MNYLENLVGMRNTLTAMNNQLTPYSTKKEYRTYLDNLTHYKKILNANLPRLNEELDVSILKTYRILDNFEKIDVKNIKAQIENGTR
jgi:uncharacterized protein (DUF885 family)